MTLNLISLELCGIGHTRHEESGHNLYDSNRDYSISNLLRLSNEDLDLINNDSVSAHGENCSLDIRSITAEAL